MAATKILPRPDHRHQASRPLTRQDGQAFGGRVGCAIGLSSDNCPSEGQKIAVFLTDFLTLAVSPETYAEPTCSKGVPATSERPGAPRSKRSKMLAQCASLG